MENVKSRGDSSSTEARQCSTLHEVVEVKPGLHWIPQNVGDAKAMRFLPRRVAYRKCNQSKRVIYVAASKGGGMEPHEPFKTKIPDTMDQLDLIFDLLSFLGFVQLLLHYFPILSFQYDNACFVSPYVGLSNLLLYFIGLTI